ncbi:MAG: hypothetical protein WD766_04065 [Gemmatimonadota bacterium]
MTSPAQLLHVVPVLLSLLVLASCAGGAFPPVQNIDRPAPAGHDWVICPGGDPSTRAQGTVGPAGGVLQHPSGHTLVIPAGAVTREHTFTIFEPTAPQLLVIATVAPNVTFQQPVSLTLSLNRCASLPPAGSLRVFRVNPTGAHDEVGGPPDQGSTAITSRLDRLSDYALVTTRSGG